MGRSCQLIVYRMEFEKTRWSCSWNSDQNCTQNSAGGGAADEGWALGVVGLGVCAGISRCHSIDLLPKLWLLHLLFWWIVMHRNILNLLKCWNFDFIWPKMFSGGPKWLQWIILNYFYSLKMSKFGYIWHNYPLRSWKSSLSIFDFDESVHIKLASNNF